MGYFLLGEFWAFSYVNMRNKHRFRVYHKSQGMYEIDSEYEVRFRKAYCLFFRFLEYHLLGWWD